MTVQAPNWFVTQYADRAMAIYQNKGHRLRPMVTAAQRIENAEKAIFWLGGKTKAVKKTRNQRNVPGNSARKKFEVPLETWKVFDTVEEFDLDRMNVDEREVVYAEGGMALGRATDSEIYAKMRAAHPTIDGGLNFAGEPFGIADALTICEALQDQHVPWDGQAYCGLPSRQFNQLLAYKEFNSADHVGGDLPFTKATDTRFWNGVNWFLQVEEDPDDLYRVSEANTMDLFAWHKTAMGWSNHTDMQVIPQWDNYEDWWTINMTAKGAATTLQEGKGIAAFRVSTNIAITTPDYETGD